MINFVLRKKLAFVNKWSGLSCDNAFLLFGRWKDICRFPKKYANSGSNEKLGFKN